MSPPACTVCRAAHRKCTRNCQPCSSCIEHPWTDSTQAQECQYTDPSTGEVLDFAAWLADQGWNPEDGARSRMLSDQDSASRTNQCGQHAPVFEPSAAYPFIGHFGPELPSDSTSPRSHYAPSECSALPSGPDLTVPGGPDFILPPLSPSDSFSHSLRFPILKGDRRMHEGMKSTGAWPSLCAELGPMKAIPGEAGNANPVSVRLEHTVLSVQAGLLAIEPGALQPTPSNGLSKSCLPTSFVSDNDQQAGPSQARIPWGGQVEAPTAQHCTHLVDSVNYVDPPRGSFAEIDHEYWFADGNGGIFCIRDREKRTLYMDRYGNRSQRNW